MLGAGLKAANPVSGKLGLGLGLIFAPMTAWGMAKRQMGAGRGLV